MKEMALGNAMPRFVVLSHDWPTPHFDLLLEAGGVLKAWRLFAEPLGPVAAEPNFDHRLLYLEYEGPLSGDRGRVRRWDSGTYNGEIGVRVTFTGERLRGEWQWRAEGERWKFHPT